MKLVRNRLLLIFLGAILLVMTGCSKQISGIKNSDDAVVSFIIDPAAETYKIEGNLLYSKII